MLKKLTRALLIFHTIAEIRSGPNSLLSKLVNDKRWAHNESIEKKSLLTESNDPGVDFACRYKHPSVKGPAVRFTVRAKARFINLRNNDTTEKDEMEAPAGKVSILNLFSDDEDEEDNEGENDSDGDAETKTEEEDDYGVGFFDNEDLDELNGTKSESFLKQYHRQNLRMHHLVFPLLLAYKLKFFTVIPLLLGSLVLLVGTTGLAGFFFALFAAALGIRAKSHH